MNAPIMLAPTLAPPANSEAEVALLAALMHRNALIEPVAELVEPEDFAEGIHGRIYRAMLALHRGGSHATPVTLKNYFEHDGALTTVGGPQYLAKVAASIISTVNAADYAKVIADCAKRRRLIEIAQDIMLQAATPELERDAAALVEEAEAALAGLTRRDDGGGLQPVAELVDDAVQSAEFAWKNKGKILGVTTGLVDLDKILGGMRAGELTVLAGRPAMGKSTAGKTIMMAAALSGIEVAVFAQEMSKKLLTSWFLADSTGISGHRQRNGYIAAEDITRLSIAADEVRALPIHVDDRTGLTVAQIRHQCRRLKRKRGLGLIVVDHIGLLNASEKAQRQGETAIVTEIANSLLVLAKEMDCPVLAVSQLNRAVEGRDDKRPSLADLRSSGAVEQNANVVIFCFRAAYYLEKEEPIQKTGEAADKFLKRLSDWNDAMDRERGKADLIVAKNRSGPVGTVKCRFDPEHSRFENLYRGEDER